MKAKFILKISLKNIKSHPLREAVVLLFLAVSLALFCMSVSAAEFSYNEAVAECLYKYEDAYVVYSNDGNALTEEEKGSLSAVGGSYASIKYGGLFMTSYISCFFGPITETDTTEDTDGESANSIHVSDYIVCPNEDFISEMEWSVSGKLPSAENEIAISGCLFGQFLEHKYYDYINYPLTTDENWNAIYDERGIKEFSSADEFLAMSPVVYLQPDAGEDATEVTIVGIIDCGECPVHTGKATSEDKFVEMYDGIFVGEEFFNSVSGDGYMMFAGKDSEEECLALAEVVADSDMLDFNSPVIRDLTAQSSILGQLKTTFLWIAVALVVFSVGLTYWVISFSIEKRKGDVGILRANGAKRSDVALIFFFESIITALAQAAIAIVASAVAIPAINSTLAEYISVPITFIRLTPLAAICAVIISVLLNALATVVPVVKTANKLPIDCIKNYIE